MYLKGIKANGFKSFASKIELNLDKGITCIVGPNGSGKSNIVDAVRWVLGEQSVKTLRGTGSMSDIIFSGSKSRNAMNRASVSLIFDNTDHYLNSEFNEIEVKRVVYRTGENEYYLNNVKVRLKDITELFIDSGASKESYNIISQGSVDEIVNSKPESRRIIFEEASGVLKYKKHKEESLRKLEKANENLERVDLLINELNTTLEPLKEQSIKAKKYLDYKKDLENIEVSLIVCEIKDLNDNYTKLKAHADELRKSLEEISFNNNKDIAKLENLKLKCLKIEEEISNKNEELIKLEKELSDTNAKKQLISERKKYEVDNNTLNNNIISLKEDSLKLDKDIKVLEQSIKDNKDYLNNCKNKYEEIENELLSLRKERFTYNNEYNIKNKSLLDTKNKIDIINDNIMNNTFLPLGVKSILNNPRLKGIHSTVGKIIDVKEEYITAIDTVLGTNKNVIVVDNEISAKNAIKYLKDNRLGRATFFPLNIIKERFIEDNILNSIKSIKGYIDIASNLVSYDSIYSNIIKNQLGNIIVVDNIDTLNIIAKKINYRYRIVTLEGDISLTGGALTGGINKNKDSNLDDKYKLNNLEKLKVNLEEEIKSIENKLSELNSKEANLTSKSNEYQKEVIEYQEIINRKNINLNELLNNYKSIQDELSSIDSKLNNSLDKELENVINTYYKLNTNKDILNNELNKLKNDLNDYKLEISTLELENKKINSNYNKYQSELNSIEVTLGKLDVKLDSYLLTLNEDYNMTYEGAIGNVDINIDVDTSRLQVSKLKSLIKELGEVNIGSISEYERLNTRYEFLSNQKEDITSSMNSLNKAISEMDSIMESKFISTFNKINEEFKKVFTTLFRGGNAHLELTDPNNLLETGIEILAQPPGKKLNSTIAFSGGERALTAISLLFSILNVKTVPFVILDEVEAALDEANVDIFGKYLETKKDKSQFIIITHKKKTMEYADVLYGITMQEEGVSKLVSVKLDDK